MPRDMRSSVGWTMWIFAFAPVAKYKPVRILFDFGFKLHQTVDVRQCSGMVICSSYRRGMSSWTRIAASSQGCMA